MRLHLCARMRLAGLRCLVELLGALSSEREREWALELLVRVYTLGWSSPHPTHLSHASDAKLVATVSSVMQATCLACVAAPV